jgi:hypothetical protein
LFDMPKEAMPVGTVPVLQLPPVSKSPEQELAS